MPLFCRCLQIATVLPVVIPAMVVGLACLMVIELVRWTRGGIDG